MGAGRDRVRHLCCGLEFKDGAALQRRRQRGQAGLQYACERPAPRRARQPCGCAGGNGGAPAGAVELAEAAPAPTGLRAKFIVLGTRNFGPLASTSASVTRVGWVALLVPVVKVVHRWSKVYPLCVEGEGGRKERAL
jgi:hypothetical protein